MSTELCENNCFKNTCSFLSLQPTVIDNTTSIKSDVQICHTCKKIKHIVLGETDVMITINWKTPEKPNIVPPTWKSISKTKFITNDSYKQISEYVSNIKKQFPNLFDITILHVKLKRGVSVGPQPYYYYSVKRHVK